jgi:hypothetical protein
MLQVSSWDEPSLVSRRLCKEQRVDCLIGKEAIGKKSHGDCVHTRVLDDLKSNITAYNGPLK